MTEISTVPHGEADIRHDVDQHCAGQEVGLHALAADTPPPNVLMHATAAQLCPQVISRGGAGEGPAVARTHRRRARRVCVLFPRAGLEASDNRVATGL